jgi:pyridoxamine 5'-phosphate oxidase
MALATADRSGHTSTRIIAFSELTDRGVVFTTHSTSQKGRELAVNPWASGLLYWRETGQQVSVSGPVRQLSNAAADALWFARPVALHSMSAVSHQSAPLLDAAALLADAQRLQATGTPLPRPARFAAYRLDVDRAEFWAPSEDRLHRRLRYERVAGGWRATRLQP